MLFHKTRIWGVIGTLVVVSLLAGCSEGKKLAPVPVPSAIKPAKPEVHVFFEKKDKDTGKEGKVTVTVDDKVIKTDTTHTRVIVLDLKWTNQQVGQTLTVDPQPLDGPIEYKFGSGLAATYPCTVGEKTYTINLDGKARGSFKVVPS